MFFVNKTVLTRTFFAAICLFLVACGVGNEQGFTQAVEVNTKNLTAISVTSSNDRVKVGETETYTALGIVGDGASQIDVSASVKWSSSDAAIVSINSEGVASGISNGMVDIIASLSDLSNSKSLRSSDAELSSIAISNSPLNIPQCQTSSQQLVATGSYTDGGQANISDKVTWSSNASSTIYVGDEALSDGSREDKGVLSALSLGSATLLASHGDIDSPGVDISVVTGLSSISISSEDDTLYAGKTSQFSAAGDYGSDPVDITENVRWVSSETSVLAFSDTDMGLAELLTSGSTNIMATCDPGGSGELSSALSLFDVEEAVSVTSLRIKHGRNSYDDGDTISLDLEDGEEQLELYFVYSNDDEGSSDLADETETIWSVVGSPLSGEAAEISNSGLLTFDATGESEYKVRYKDDDNNINVDIDFFLKVE